MIKFTIKKKAEVLKPTSPKPSVEPANGYQWSWNVQTAQWEQVPINSKDSYNITDSNNTTNLSNSYTTQSTGYTTASLDDTETIQCLNQFMNVDDFDDGILYVNSLKYIPKAKLYEDGLVEYAGYDVINGSKVRITKKGLLLLKHIAQKDFNQVKSNIDIDEEINRMTEDINEVPSTIQGNDFPIEGISPKDGAYDYTQMKFANDKNVNHIIDILEDKYYNELEDIINNDGDLTKKIKEILINEGIKIDDMRINDIVEYFYALFM